MRIKKDRARIARTDHPTVGRIDQVLMLGRERLAAELAALDGRSLARFFDKSAERS
jgi:hypothetical protein